MDRKDFYVDRKDVYVDRKIYVVFLHMDFVCWLPRPPLQNFSGPPKKLPGPPKKLSGPPKKLSGPPKKLSGPPKKLTGPHETVFPRDPRGDPWGRAWEAMFSTVLLAFPTRFCYFPNCFFAFSAKCCYCSCFFAAPPLKETTRKINTLIKYEIWS